MNLYLAPIGTYSVGISSKNNYIHLEEEEKRINEMKNSKRPRANEADFPKMVTPRNTPRGSSSSVYYHDEEFLQKPRLNRGKGVKMLLVSPFGGNVLRNGSMEEDTMSDADMEQEEVGSETGASGSASLEQKAVKKPRIFAPPSTLVSATEPLSLPPRDCTAAVKPQPVAAGSPDHHMKHILTHQLLFHNVKSLGNGAPTTATRLPAPVAAESSTTLTNGASQSMGNGTREENAEDTLLRVKSTMKDYEIRLQIERLKEMRNHLDTVIEGLEKSLV